MKKTEIAKIIEQTPNAVFNTRRGYIMIKGFTTKGQATAVTAHNVYARKNDETGAYEAMYSDYGWKFTLTQIENKSYDSVEEFIAAKTKQAAINAAHEATKAANHVALAQSMPALNDALANAGINNKHIYLGYKADKVEITFTAAEVALLIDALNK